MPAIISKQAKKRLSEALPDIVQSCPFQPLFNPWRLAASMMQNVVGCVVVALIIIGVLAVLHERHEECRHGRLIKTHMPCGSVSPSV